MTRNFVLVTSTLVLGAVLFLSCGSSPTPPPSPSPRTPAYMPDISGDWSGALEASTFSTRTISAKLFQPAPPEDVSGSWYTVDSGPRWVGAITAALRPDSSLYGQMSFELLGSSKACTGVGTLTGAVTSNTATLTWTITGYNADTCTSGVPERMTVKLQR